MDSDMKWFTILIAAFVVLPLLGLGISDWHKQNCRVELAKVGKTTEEIKELCK
jgi:predicted Na+-dependent transporter